MFKRKLKPWVKTTIIATVVSTGVFAFSSLAFSNSDWKNENLTKASQEFSEAGYNKKEQLKTKKVDSVVTEDLTPFIEEQEKELLRLMDEYWNLKAQGYANNSQEIEKVKTQIITVRDAVLERYKDEIDLMFPQQ